MIININSLLQVSDPFTRRKTQPVLPTHVIKKTEASAAASNNGVSDSNGSDHEDKENSVKKPETAGATKPEAAEDLFSAHDFDITIDLGKIISILAIPI